MKLDMRLPDVCLLMNRLISHLAAEGRYALASLADST